MSLLDDLDVNAIARKAFEGATLEGLRHTISARSEETIGYLGNHLTLSLTALYNGIEVRKLFFVKTYEVKKNQEDFIGETGIFQKEVDLYKDLVESMASVLGKSTWCPKYYYSKSRALVLEDLSEIGFKMATDGISLDREHLRVALQTLSTMHAWSLLLEQEKSMSLNTAYPQIFREILYDEDNLDAPSRKWIFWQTEDLLIGIDYLDKYSKYEKKLIKERFADEIKRIYQLSKPSQKHKNVLTHGDVWRNNLLFRYCENKVVDCRLVDFQFARYAPPAHDVMHIIYYATTKAFRNKEDTRLLKYYYENLDLNLKTHGKDVRDTMVWEEFVESCNEYRELALIQSLLSSHYILGPVNLKTEIESYDKHEDFLAANRKDYMKKFFDKKSYAEKITDALEELIDSYVLQ